jgi:hypothetical protein
VSQPPDVGEGGLDAEVGLEQLGDLLHVVAEFVVGIFDAGAGLYWAGLAARSILTASKVSSPVAWKMLSPLSPYMAWKGVGGGRWSGAAAADGEAVDVGERDGGNLAGQCARNLRAESEGAKGGVFLGMAMAQVFSLQGAVEPAVFSALDAGRAGFHVVLRVEVGAGHIGRAGGVDDGEMPWS